MEAKQFPINMYGIYPSDYSQFWFLYEKETRRGQTQLVIRPFYSNYRENFSAHEFATSFYPFYYSEKTNYWKRSTFLFLFTNDSTMHEDSGEDSDLILSPLFMWGKGGTEKDRYVGFFPFYGKIKSRLSWSELNFFLFPLYTNWSHKEFKVHSILWPLTIYGSSDVRQEFRVFPFYSNKSHLGKYEHTSLLWPFFSWGVDNLDKKEPTSYGFAWLLFSYKNSYYGNMKSYGILPIIGSMSFASYGYDNRTTEKNYSLFFFLFQYGYSNDKDYRKLIIFPFYAYSKYASKEFRFITPFYLRSNSDTYGIKSDSLHILPPFFHYMQEVFVKEERTDLYWKVWPFIKWHRDAEGNISTNMLSLFPVRSDSFELVWDPIWSIWEYQNNINGEKRFSLLMRLYTQRWSENENHFYIPLLMDYSNTEEYYSWYILYGLIGYKKTNEKGTVKLFWFIDI
jgi:hypothetical protein